MISRAIKLSQIMILRHWVTLFLVHIKFIPFGSDQMMHKRCMVHCVSVQNVSCALVQGLTVRSKHAKQKELKKPYCCMHLNCIVHGKSIDTKYNISDNQSLLYWAHKLDEVGACSLLQCEEIVSPL